MEQKKTSSISTMEFNEPNTNYANQTVFGDTRETVDIMRPNPTPGVRDLIPGRVPNLGVKKKLGVQPDPLNHPRGSPTLRKRQSKTDINLESIFSRTSNTEIEFL